MEGARVEMILFCFCFVIFWHLPDLRHSGFVVVWTCATYPLLIVKETRGGRDHLGGLGAICACVFIRLSDGVSKYINIFVSFRFDLLEVVI